MTRLAKPEFGCLWYIDDDGSAYPTSGEALDGRDAKLLGRLYGNLHGIQLHGERTSGIKPAPCTAIRRIESVAFYDGHEIMANNWKLTGLEPCAYHTMVILEEE